MGRSTRPIDDFFWMSKRPGSAGRYAGIVAHVGPCRDVAAEERGPHRAVRNVSSVPAIANAVELSIPACGRHPDLEIDHRVTGRPRHAHCAAEGRHVEGHPGRGNELPGRYEVGRGDRRIRQIEAGEALARLRLSADEI